MNGDTRPVFLNLLQIRFPAMAVASILHRISGVLLYLAIFPGLYLLQLALQGPAGFARAQAMLDSLWVRLLLLLVIWSLLHHLLAGIRFLLLDLDVGLPLASARWSAISVSLLAAVLSLGIWGSLWL